MFTLFNHFARTEAAYEVRVTAADFAAAVDAARVGKSVWTERADDNSGTYVWVRGEGEPYGHAVGFVSNSAGTPLAASRDNRQGWLYYASRVARWLGVDQGLVA